MISSFSKAWFTRSHERDARALRCERISWPFFDLGGVDGLIHITDLSWGRVSHPEEVVSLDQKLNVVILDFDDEKKRIALEHIDNHTALGAALDEALDDFVVFQSLVYTLP